MRKLTALALAFALALLCGCAAPEPEEPTTPDPNRPPAIMEPLQGGPMLYAFPDDSGDPWWGAYGLINQDGVLIAEPQYNNIQYVYSDAAQTRVIGLIAEQWIDTKYKSFTYYSLDGTAKMLNCEGDNIDVCPGGRYAVVSTEIREDEALYLVQELFDIEANACIAEGDISSEYLASAQHCQNPPPLDPGLQSIFTREFGDIIRPFDGPTKGYVLLDERQQVKASCDAYGKPLLVSDTAYILSTVVNYPWCYKLKNGVWQSLNLKPYGLRQDFGDYFFQEAVVLAVCDDFLWINGWHDCAMEEQPWDEYTPSEFFALDWDGNPYPDCPMEPFSDNFTFSSDASGRYVHYITAGEQGPYYYWVEHNGQRGYINTAGDWLFIDES